MAQHDLSDDAKQLLTAGEQKGYIDIYNHHGGGGTTISAGGQKFTDGTPRSVARWEQALRELENGGFVERTGELCRITHSGFQMIDTFKAGADC